MDRDRIFLEILVLLIFSTIRCISLEILFTVCYLLEVCCQSLKRMSTLIPFYIPHMKNEWLLMKR